MTSELPERAARHAENAVAMGRLAELLKANASNIGVATGSGNYQTLGYSVSCVV